MSELITQGPRQLAPVDPMQLIANAIEKGVDIDQLTKLMDLQERWESGNAKKAFVAAMAEFKKDPPKLVKDKQVSFGNTSYKHAELDQVTEKVAKALSAVNISHRFEIEQTEKAITVTCVLTHIAGHSERTPLSAGSDKSGGKNDIQAIGSAVSYLQRYTLLAATGLATGEGDDDGRGYSPSSNRLSDLESPDGSVVRDDFYDVVNRVISGLSKGDEVMVYENATYLNNAEKMAAKRLKLLSNKDFNAIKEIIARLDAENKK